MFLHIGGSRVIAAKDIIGIFDIRIREKQSTREFLQTAKVRDDNGDEEVKSFIVTKETVSFSPIAPVTLKKRFQANIFDK
ncbi:MAG: DUF370 domain-containing protein [Bacillota bacterium]|nr:DUF370 domain-containing protein [Bacillota bacterium]MDW7684300.1 DUF370 domain-containing protein [Bacillota bacterium]